MKSICLTGTHITGLLDTRVLVECMPMNMDEPCTVGKLGDVLWVKEDFQAISDSEGEEGWLLADIAALGTDVTHDAEVDVNYGTGLGYRVVYTASYPPITWWDYKYGETDRVARAKAMPRWASRLSLKIEDVSIGSARKHNKKRMPYWIVQYGINTLDEKKSYYSSSVRASHTHTATAADMDYVIHVARST